MRRLIAIAAVVALGLVGCGQPAALSASAPAAASQVGDVPRTQVQTALADAIKAAKVYRQQNLGHVMDMDLAALEDHDLVLPADVTLAIETDHSDFCLIATSTALPAGDDWQVASASSTTQTPVPADTCGT